MKQPYNVIRESGKGQFHRVLRLSKVSLEFRENFGQFQSLLNSLDAVIHVIKFRSSFIPSKSSTSTREVRGVSYNVKQLRNYPRSDIETPYRIGSTVTCTSSTCSSALFFSLFFFHATLSGAAVRASARAITSTNVQNPLTISQ